MIEVRRVGAEGDAHWPLLRTLRSAVSCATDIAPLPFSGNQVIEFRNVSRSYRRFPGRDTLALADFSVTLRPGEVVGIAGPNGAGKSTLIALLLGFLRPATGEIVIDGLSPRAFIERNGAGYLPETVSINRDWRLEESLLRLGALGGLSRAELCPRIDHVLGALDLLEHKGKLIRELSKGTVQRLCIAQVLIQDHDLVVYDEPTHGLDPVQSYAFRDIITGSTTESRITIIASHNLDELERVADRVLILDRGRLQRDIDLGDKREAGQTYRLAVISGNEHVIGVFPQAIRVAADLFDLPATDPAALNAGLALLLQKGCMISSVAPVSQGLEQQFLSAIGR